LGISSCPIERRGSALGSEGATAIAGGLHHVTAIKILCLRSVAIWLTSYPVALLYFFVRQWNVVQSLIICLAFPSLSPGSIHNVTHGHCPQGFLLNFVEILLHSGCPQV
jgi:hypothetical protein